MTKALLTYAIYILTFVLSVMCVQYYTEHIMGIRDEWYPLTYGPLLYIMAEVEAFFFLIAYAVIYYARLVKRPLFIPMHRLAPSRREMLNAVVGMLLVYVGSVVLTTALDNNVGENVPYQFYRNPVNVVFRVVIYTALVDLVFRHALIRHLTSAAFPPLVAVLASSVLFGVTKGNGAQGVEVGIEAFALGMLYPELFIGEEKVSATFCLLRKKVVPLQSSKPDT